MRKFYTLLSFMFLALAVLAQPSVTEINMPVIGDAPTRGICSDIPNASTLNAETGASYSWDFSGLTEISTATFDFIEPSNSYWPSAFVNSDLCGIAPEVDGYTFYSVSNSMLESDGLRLIVGPGDTVRSDYTDSEIVMNLPATFGNSNSDNFSGTAYASSINLTTSGLLSYSIDGYGTLQLPNGTYQNVIRYHANRSETYSLLGNPAGTTTKEQWIWISADYRFWLLLMETINDPINGTSNSVWYQKTPVAVNPTGITNVNAENFTIYPNPVATNGTLQLSRALVSNETIRLFDMQGRVVRSFSNASSIISLDGVNTGLYMLQVLNENGNAISTQKLIVQ